MKINNYTQDILNKYKYDRENMMKQTVKQKKDYKSDNLKNGGFKESELEQYETRRKDIEVILAYQLLLPVLLVDDNTMVDARTLHSQLGIGKRFTTWMIDMVEKYAFEEGVEFFPNSGETSIKGGRPSIEYSITLDTAKQLAMVQNNERGKIARKYFIAIERAFKNRLEWNDDRKDTLIHCRQLQHALMKYRPQLLENKPSWAYSVQQAEFCMFNNIVLGMSASDYRKLNGLKKNDSVRNKFSEVQLEYVADLEEYDAKLISTQLIFDYNEREKILTREFINLSKTK